MHRHPRLLNVTVVPTFALPIYNYLSNLLISEQPFSEHEYSFASKDVLLIREINRILLQLKENGNYERLYNKWFEAKEKEANLLVVYIILSILRSEERRVW